MAALVSTESQTEPVRVIRIRKKKTDVSQPELASVSDNTPLSTGKMSTKKRNVPSPTQSVEKRLHFDHQSSATNLGPQPHSSRNNMNQAPPMGYRDNGPEIQDGDDEDTEMFNEDDLDTEFHHVSLDNDAQNRNINNINGQGNTGPNRGQFPPMGLDTEAKEAWKSSRKLANKSAENDIFIQFIQSCIEKKIVPEMVKLTKRVPTNFCHGSPMTPEPKSQETWDKALKASSLVLLQHTLAMAQSKKRSLSIRLEAQNNMLKALIDNQAKFDEVMGIRKILVDKHTDTQKKRSEARLARLIATGSDNPPPDQNQDQRTPPN